MLMHLGKPHFTISAERNARRWTPGQDKCWLQIFLNAQQTRWEYRYTVPSAIDIMHEVVSAVSTPILHKKVASWYLIGRWGWLPVLTKIGSSQMQSWRCQNAARVMLWIVSAFWKNKFYSKPHQNHALKICSEDSLRIIRKKSSDFGQSYGPWGP